MKANKLGKTSILLAATDLVTLTALHFLVSVTYMQFNTQLNSINFIVLSYQVNHVNTNLNSMYQYLFSPYSLVAVKPLLIRSSIFARLNFDISASLVSK